MNVGALPQIEAGEMETEAAHYRAQCPQAAVGQVAAAVFDQRMVHHIKLTGEIRRSLIGRRGAGRMARRRAEASVFGGCRQARIDAGYGAAIGLPRPVRRHVRRAFGQCRQVGGNRHQGRRHRELGAELMQFIEIEGKYLGPVTPRGFLQHIGGDKRIAVAVAADPTADPEEGRDWLGPAAAGDFRQPVLDVAVDFRQLGKEGVVVIGQTVTHFVEHVQTALPQQAGLPEHQHPAADRCFDVIRLRRRQIGFFVLDQEPGDGQFVFHDALAADFARMRGEDWLDMGVGEEGAQGRGVDAGGRRLAQGMGDGAMARRVAGPVVTAGPANVMLVFGDIGQMREQTEGAHDVDGLDGVELVEDRFQFRFRRRIVALMVAHRGQADRFNQIKGGLTLLRAQGIAEQAPQQTDIVSEWCILVRIFRFFCHRSPNDRSSALAIYNKAPAGSHIDICDRNPLTPGRCHAHCRRSGARAGVFRPIDSK